MSVNCLFARGVAIMDWLGATAGIARFRMNREKSLARSERSTRARSPGRQRERARPLPEEYGPPARSGARRMPSFIAVQNAGRRVGSRPGLSGIQGAPKPLNVRSATFVQYRSRRPPSRPPRKPPPPPPPPERGARSSRGRAMFTVSWRPWNSLL
jgi:hypothetical protein